MGIEFVGGSVHLSGKESKEIKVEYARDAEIRQIMVNSDARTKLTSFAVLGIEEFITGRIELDHFKQHGNIYTLPEPIPYSKGTTLVVGLTGLTTSENDVYVAFVMVY